MQILFILQNHDELCVCEIYKGLELEQSNVSQHLKILSDKGILTTRKDGLKVMYRVKYPEVYAMMNIAIYDVGCSFIFTVYYYVKKVIKTILIGIFVVITSLGILIMEFLFNMTL